MRLSSFKLRAQELITFGVTGAHICVFRNVGRMVGGMLLTTCSIAAPAIYWQIPKDTLYLGETTAVSLIYSCEQPSEVLLPIYLPQTFSGGEIIWRTQATEELTRIIRLCPKATNSIAATLTVGKVGNHTLGDSSSSVFVSVRALESQRRVFSPSTSYDLSTPLVNITVQPQPNNNRGLPIGQSLTISLSVDRDLDKVAQGEVIEGRITAYAKGISESALPQLLPVMKNLTLLDSEGIWMSRHLPGFIPEYRQVLEFSALAEPIANEDLHLLYLQPIKWLNSGTGDIEFATIETVEFGSFNPANNADIEAKPNPVATLPPSLQTPNNGQPTSEANELITEFLQNVPAEVPTSSLERVFFLLSFAGLSAVFLGLWLKAEKKNRKLTNLLKERHNINTIAANEKEALRQLYATLKGGNPLECRRQLLQWGREYTQNPHITIDRLADQVHPDLAIEIRRLNAACYAEAKESKSWKSAGLIRNLKLESKN